MFESEQTASVDVEGASAVELVVTGFEVVVDATFSVVVVGALDVVELVVIGFVVVVVAIVDAIVVSPGQNPHDLAQF